MGWVVYEEATGRAVKYYRKESVAKTQVTKQRNLVRSMPNVWGRDVTWIYCSYADYEGVLMGMQEPERKMWAFCRG
jgi:hypothetical protein